MIRLNTFFDQIYLLCSVNDLAQRLLILQKLNRLQLPAVLLDLHADKPTNSLYKQILTHASKANHQRILILRSDVIFHQAFHEQVHTQLKALPQQWKLLHLGAHQFSGQTGSGLPARRLGAFAIALHTSSFNILLRSIDQFQGEFDAVHLQRLLFQFPDQCFCFQPQLVISSMLQHLADHPKLLDSTRKAFQWQLEAYDYPFQPDLVSIIMPAYNRAKTIEKAIRSALGQSYSAFELLVIDDASTDETVAVVKTLMREDNRIKLIQRQENGGVGLARNDGIRQAKGRFIAFHDSDDIMFKDRLVKQLLPFYECGVLFTLARVIRSHCEMEELQLGRDAYNLALARSRTSSEKNGIPIGDERERIYPATIIFRREVFERWGLYWDSRYAEDLELIERILFEQHRLHFADMQEMPMAYLERLGYVEGTAKVIPEVLCIASKRQSDNLTKEYSKKHEEVQAFLHLYRDRLLGKGTYQYPQLDPSKYVAVPKILSYKPLGQKPNSAGLTTSHELIPKKYVELEEKIKQIQQSFSWRITKPLRFLGKIFYFSRRKITNK